MHRAPYFDWRLDRWKIGLALLLWLGLILFPPAPSAPLDPQGASPIARPGQRPVVGASTTTEPVAAASQGAEPIAPSSESEVVRVESAGKTDDATGPAVAAPLTLAIWEPGRTPLKNSTPLFYGQTAADGLVEILLEGRRYASLADSNGYWQFTPAAPLPVGMTWVQARQVESDGSLLSSPQSQMALVGPDAVPVSAPGILTPLSSASTLEDSTPLLSGIGPPGIKLLFLGQSGADREVRAVGQTTVNGDGTWLWQTATPLEAGHTTLWAVAADEAGRPLSRSWPVTLAIAADALPSVEVELPTAEVDRTR